MRDLVHSVISFSSHVPAAFHADPVLLFANGSGDAVGIDAGESIRFGVISPSRAVSVDDNSRLKYVVVLPEEVFL